MAVSHGSLPFQEQIDYFRGKVNLPTRAWTDIYTAEHDYAFVVAGAVKRDLLADLRGAVEKSIATGTTLEQFRKDFDQVVGKHGWQYQGERGWRTNVIWETNLRQSYNAGREAQIADPELRKRRPYGVYRHGDSAHPRPQHLAWNGITLPLDDPWWAYHTPQNGWGCKCKKYMASERDLVRMGLEVGPAPEIEWEDRVVGKNSPNGPRTVRVPKGVDPGFEHAPGQSRLSNSVPQLRANDSLLAPGQQPAVPAPGLPNGRPAGALPMPRSVPAGRLLPASTSVPKAVAKFLGEFGADTAPAVFRDVTGDALVIGREMFSGAKAGAIQLAPHVLARELPLLAEAIKAPDEVWARLEWLPDQGKAVLRRRYLAHFQVKGQAAPAVAVFDQGADDWTGATGFVEDSEQYLEALRLGVRLYRRAE
ncbi:phage head morphogenesis protein, SPP1 gp7 [Pseudomonas chlororaphis subsp. aurantiaca]|uniref:PBECR2 nuclease fold domain-containing protein n=1 Tax=Pseudomonas chlororaphis TaxID=587753 RepID=UPI00086506CC|nr:PBECR2 nuclease fold domain-containing protein [Pseudomonas chlororaphis]BAV74120.1 phage head morphogenesis protein, SPP1 gp7 [Pseudomonas chlororaphis subsp. aurantiaca]